MNYEIDNLIKRQSDSLIKKQRDNFNEIKERVASQYIHYLLGLHHSYKFEDIKDERLIDLVTRGSFECQTTCGKVETKFLYNDKVFAIVDIDSSGSVTIQTQGGWYQHE